MNKSELIKYLVKQSGISIGESKLFFESILRILSTLLLPGDSIRLPDEGYFHFRKAKLDTRSALLKDKLFAEKLLDIIIYSPDPDYKKTHRQNLIFNVPEPYTVEVDFLDNYFSLSIDKQLVPLIQSDYESIFIPRSSAELKRFVETKAKKFIEQCEMIKNNKTSAEPVVIGSDAVFGKHSELNWNEINSDRSEIDSVSKELTENISYENISWNFSSELEKEIKEDEILDFSQDEILTKTIEDGLDNLSWDFGLSENSKFSLENVVETPVEIITSESQTGTDIDSIKLSTDEIELQIKALSDIVLNEEQLDETDKFQRVVAAVESEIKNESSVEIDKPELDHISKSRRNVYPVDIKEIISQVSETKIEKKEDDIKKEFLSKKNSIFKEKDFDNKHRSPFWVVIVFTVLIIVFILYYFVLSKGGSTQSNIETNKVKKAEIINPDLIVERNFEIPVTYPYSKGNNLRVAEFDPLSSLVLSDERKSVEVIDNMVGSTTINEQSSAIEIREGQNYSNAGRNIFKYPDGYALQVASYKALTMAEEEAKKYIKQGNTAFVQKVNLKGMGIWYRVKVSGFKTLEEAQRFSNTKR